MMTSVAEQTQILYEIAMDIGVGFDLRAMLKRCLHTMLRKLNCSAGVVLATRRDQGPPRYEEVFSVPRNLHRHGAYRSVLARISAGEALPPAGGPPAALPADPTHGAGAHFHLLDLPGYGLLVLLKGEGRLPPDFVKSLQPLCRKLADACRACATQQELERTKEDLRITLDSIGDAVIATDTSGRIVRMNPVAEELTGWPAEQARGRKLDEVFRICNAQTGERAADPVGRVLATGRVVGLANHTRLISRDGRECDIADSGAPIQGGDGSLTGVVLVFRDVTDEYRTQQTLRHNERFLEDVFEAIQDGISVLDRELNVVRTNHWMERMYDNEAPLRGKKCYAAYQRRDAPCPWCPTVKAMETGLPQTAEVPYPDAEAATGWLELTAFPLRNEEGELQGAIEYVKDISESKRAAQALHESEARYRAVFEAAGDAIFVATGEVFLDCNRRALEMFACSREHILGHSPLKFSPPVQPDGSVSAEKAGERIRAALDGDPQLFQWQHCRLDGTPFDAEVSLNRVELSTGAHILAVVRDISERKRAEEALQQSEQRLRILFERAADAIYVSDSEGRLLQVNAQACRATGYREEELRGLGIGDVNTGMTTPEELHALVERLAPGHPVTLESRHRRKNGSTFPVEMTVALLETAEGPQLIGIARDITERQRARQELERSKTFLETLLEQLPVGMQAAKPPHCRLFLANREAERITGLPRRKMFEIDAEHLEQLAWEMYHPDGTPWPVEELPLPKAVLQGLETHNAEMLLRGVDGVERTILCNAAPVRDPDGAVISGVVSFLDISERKRAEEQQRKLEAQLRQSQKMEAVGQLAGGVAHDFNNILTTILGNVELSIDDIRRELGPAHGVLKSLEEVEEATQRASALTRQLLTFSRRDVVKPEVLDLNRVLAGVDKMLRRLITENITLETQTEPQLRPVQGDVGQVEQVIVNLVVNAVQAMPDGGRLTLETRNVSLDEGYTRTHAEACAGPHVLLAVSDTGHGMDAATCERIFEPFFTTKVKGQGTGLGLATVHGIVKRAEGHIVVSSEPGRGTTFRIYLPATDAQPVEQETTPEKQASHQGQETILLCEDDRVVRELIGLSLRSAGYAVLTAANGREGLEAAQHHPGPIDLLITDVIMPDLNGRVVSDRLQASRPGLPTLFISGYPSDVIAHHGVLDEGVEFLEKPFTRQDLLARIREVLCKSRKGA